MSAGMDWREIATEYDRSFPADSQSPVVVLARAALALSEELAAAVVRAEWAEERVNTWSAQTRRAEESRDRMHGALLQAHEAIEVLNREVAAS